MTESQRSLLRFLKKYRRDGDAEGRSGNGLAAAIRDTGFSGFQRGGPVIQSNGKNGGRSGMADSFRGTAWLS